MPEPAADKIRRNLPPMIHAVSNATIWTFTPAESSRPWIYISAHYFYLEEEGWCEVGRAVVQKTQWLEAKVKSRL